MGPLRVVARRELRGKGGRRAYLAGQPGRADGRLAGCRPEGGSFGLFETGMMGLRAQHWSATRLVRLTRAGQIDRWSPRIVTGQPPRTRLALSIDPTRWRVVVVNCQSLRAGFSRRQRDAGIP